MVFSFLALFVLSTMLVAQIFWSLVTPIVFALVLLSIFFPVYRSILSAVNGRTTLAASLCVTLVFLLVFLPLGYFVSKLASQAVDYYYQSKSSDIFKQVFSGFSNDNSFIDQIRAVAREYGITVSTETLSETVREVIQKFVQLIYDALGQIAAHSLLIILNIVLTFVILFALLVKGRDLKLFLMQIAPLPFDEQEKLINQFGDMSKAIFLGTGVINALQGLFGGLGFYWFDIGPGTFWGVLIFLASFIPGIGTWVIVGPAAVYLFMRGYTEAGLLYLIFSGVIFGVLEIIVKPRFIGGKSRLHAVLVLLSIIGGVQLFGVFGIFYGPLVVAMFLSLADIYRTRYRSELIDEPNINFQSHSSE